MIENQHETPIRRTAFVAALVILSMCAHGPAAYADTPYVDGVSDQNLAYWGAFFSSGFGEVVPVSFVAGWAALPPHVTYARYVAQWNETARFQTWLEHVPADVTVDLALTNYHAPESYAEGSSNYPPTPQAYYHALEGFLEVGERLYHPIAAVEPWNEPNNQGGYRQAEQAMHPAQFADEAQRLCATHECTVVAGDIEDAYGETGEYLRAYAANLDFVPSAWGVHPYRAVDDYGVAPSGMAEFEDACGECHPWFTEIGIFLCERAPGHGIYDGPAWQAEHAAYLVDRVVPRYRPEHVFYYELKVPGTEATGPPESACVDRDVTDTALYGVYGEPRPASSVVFGR
jgi:hypothetical protein